MTTNTRPKPQIDPAPLHNCGTLHRAGVITSGCPGCQSHGRNARPV